MDEETEDNWLSVTPLSVRLANVLNNHNLRTEEAVRAALGDGSYAAYCTSPLRHFHNFGWKSWQELCVIVGLPKHERPAEELWAGIWRNQEGETGDAKGSARVVLQRALDQGAISIRLRKST